MTDCILNSLARQGYWFCSADRESHRLLSVQEPLHKGLSDGLHSFPCALSSLVGGVEGSIQQWEVLPVSFPASAKKENQLQCQKGSLWTGQSSRAGKALV